MHEPTHGIDHLAEIRAATGAVVEATHRSPDAPVPACPGWDLVALAGHLGQVQRWATVIVGARLTERPGAGSSERAPSERDEVAGWLGAGIDPLLAALAGAGLDRPAWNFAGLPAVSAFWWRRMVHEAWVHAADAGEAAGSPVLIPAGVAVDTVDEFLGLLPGRRLAARPDASIGGSLHLHATDEGVHGEWMIRLERGRLEVERGHAKGDAAVRASVSELAQFVWGRRDALRSTGFEVFGDRGVVAAWQAIGAF